MTDIQDAGRREKQSCLILAGNICVGHQIATLIEAYWGRPHVLHNGRSVYSQIIKGKTGTIVADIDTEDLGGLAVLAFCHQQYPGIATYALTPADDKKRKRLARDLGGCRGFFYLENGHLRIDTSRGMAAQLSFGGLPANGRKTIRSAVGAGLQTGRQSGMK